ncbi:MAG: DUF4339 domain-containing protein [Verrucomicrobiaceae bacterium]
MNWYFEKEGISQGPVLEHDLAGRLQRGEIAGDTLVWHEAMTEWSPVGEVAPDWLKPKTALAPVATPLAKISPPSQPLTPSKQASEVTGDAEEKQGFFSRLFGAAKKKK